MKKFLFFLTILLSSLIVRGQSSPKDGIFMYKVMSITPCTIVNDEFYPEETTIPKDKRIVVVDEDYITVYIGKTSTKVTFEIQDYYFDDGNLVYVTRHNLSGDKVIIIIKRFNTSFTFSFINLNEKECYIYKTEYFE